MKLNKLYSAYVGIILTMATSSVNAAFTLTTETFRVNQAVNAIFLWADNPSDMTFDLSGTIFSSLVNWSLDTSPAGATDNSAWVFTAPGIETGAGALAANSDSPVTIGFDYFVSSGPTSSFRFQYAFVLWDNVTENIALSGTRRIRRGNTNSNTGVGKPLSAAQFNEIGTYLAAASAPAVVPVPNSVVLMACAIAFLGFSSRSTRSADV
ncbi:MAG: hypothetical protein ACI8XZ_003548 [Gammaproteobacteria bacterium]|jgi:hypothetical protein